jgi:rhodanese-related sulfurtransferase
LSPDDFQSSIADGAVQLVDVRTPEEYAEQHINGAINIDVYEDSFIEQCKARLDKDRPVAVYCRSGKRSANAAGQLRKAGFKRVLNLDGGITAWLDAAKPVAR